MQDIGRLWEQHALSCGSPVRVAILLDVPSHAPGQAGSTVHVFPVAAGNDETFLGRVLHAYTSKEPSQVLLGNTQAFVAADGDPQTQDPPLSVAPHSAVPAVPATSAPPDPNHFDGLGVAAKVGDEFGLKRFQAAWAQDRLIGYADVEHLCPRIPFLQDDDTLVGAEKPVVRLEEGAVTRFLDIVSRPSLESVTWDTVNGVTSCARFFIDKVSLNRAWYSIGPEQARTVTYVYNIAGVDQFTLSVASMASKQGGVPLHRRVLTIAVLSALSPFWRMVVVTSTLFNPGRRQVRRARQQRNPMGSPPAKKVRPGSAPAGNKGDNPSIHLGSDRPVSSLGPSAASPLSDAQELKLWQEAPGLDVEDREITQADLSGRCGWFWQNRPQPGSRCLPLMSYKTLADLYQIRGKRAAAAGTSRTFGRLVNVPGDNDCFYHVIASGLMDRLAAFPDLPRSYFWQDVGVHPGLLRWGVAAYQRAMLGNGPLSYLFPTWLALTCPGQSFDDPADSQAVLGKAIVECEGERSWMGSSHGEYAVLADILGVVIRVFSPIGCQPDGALLPAPAQLDPALFSLEDARVDVVGEEGRRRCVLRPGQDVVQLKPSCVHVPLHYVVEASRETLSGGSQAHPGVPVHNRAKELAKERRCLVLGVIHDGSAHFMYPSVHLQLLTDYTGASLPAFNISSRMSE